ncbi:MAG: hypothetical protein CR965_00275 [Paludibacter sp.]|nr:MAG: hypothetical protein CR965_00275 [Paludibacter sp.]
MRKIVIVVLSLLLSFQLFATNNTAVTRLDSLIELIKKNTVQTNFTLISKQADNNTSFTTKGIFTIKGEKFILTTKEMNIYFNGKIQWMYVSDINEVSISEPNDLEVAKINPISLLNTYREISVISINKKKSNNKVYVIELRPKKETNSDFQKIELKVKKSNNYPIFIQLTDKKGGIVILELTQFHKKNEFNEREFDFNPKKYKDIEINDLR